MPSPYEYARSQLGLSTGNRADRAAIADYLSTGGKNLSPATRAWCADFVNASLERAGMQGSGSPLARSLLNVGTPTQNPREGDIAVFSRGNPRGPYGHTGFYKGLDSEGNPIVVGGNQSGGVSEASYPKERLLGYRSLGNTLNSNPIQDASMGPPDIQNKLLGTGSSADSGEGGGGGMGGLSGIAGGLGEIAQGLNPQPSPQAAAEQAKIIPTHPGLVNQAAAQPGGAQAGGQGGEPNSQLGMASQALLAEMMKRNQFDQFGLTLNNSGGDFS